MTGRRSRASGLVAWWLPTGRIRRRDWWHYFLSFALLGVLAAVLDGYFFPEHVVWDREHHFDLLVPLPEAVGPISAVVVSVLFVTNVAALVTRLHDRDHSAWWLLWALVPGLGALVLFVTIALLGTDPRPNRFGWPPP